MLFYLSALHNINRTTYRSLFAAVFIIFYLFTCITPAQKTNQEVLPLPANRTYKDSLFSLYLSDPQRLIEVYNAIAETDYPPDTPVQMNNIYPNPTK